MANSPTAEETVSDSSWVSEASTLPVLGFAGSLRQASFNRALLRAAQERARAGMTIESFDLGRIPLYNRDVEKEGDPQPVQHFKQALSAAAALLIVTPEYQHGIPGVLKNALDWASRPPGDSPLQGKVAAVMGASTGMTGTARAQAQLRQTLVYNDMLVVPSPEVLVARAREKFDDELNLIDRDAVALIDKLLANLARLARLLYADS